MLDELSSKNKQFKDLKGIVQRWLTGVKIGMYIEKIKDIPTL